MGRPLEIQLFTQPVKPRIDQESTSKQSNRRKNNHRHINMGDAWRCRRHGVWEVLAPVNDFASPREKWCGLRGWEVLRWM